MVDALSDLYVSCPIEIVVKNYLRDTKSKSFITIWDRRDRFVFGLKFIYFQGNRKCEQIMYMIYH